MKVLQPFDVAESTLEWFRRYVRASFPLRDSDLDEQREQLIDEGLLWAPPFIRLERPGKTGPKLASLSDILLPRVLEVPWGFADLYDHQDRAIRRLAAEGPDGPKNTLVLSGTGSGKTESFLIPIVDAVLRDSTPGVKAVVIYPMNALANDQLKRLRELLGDMPEVSFGRYTGDAPETDAGDSRRPARPEAAPPNLRWSRQAMRESPPNILLTNYSMLEYLLLRGKDVELFHGGPPKYLVVDEIHLFSGVLGAEVASLLRRFRAHVGAMEGQMCVVGTSATAGSDLEQEQLRNFAERFFGSAFEDGALIAESVAKEAEPGPEVPPAPSLTDELLREARDTPGLAALARQTLGIELPADDNFNEALGSVIDTYATVSVIERALAKPASIRDAAAALTELPERAGVQEEALVREAQALLLLGAAARLPSVGEDETEPRFRPRLHQVVRSLAGLWRCIDPGHGVLRGPDGSRCSCGSLTLPLASCRTCGEAYWASPALAPELELIERLEAVDRERGSLTVFIADPLRLVGMVGEDEDGLKVPWIEAKICSSCGAFATPGRDLQHLRSCPRPAFPGVNVLASLDDVHCPACGDQGARNRPILLALKGSAAASSAVITQGLSDELRAATDEAGGRLLVFADSRQNAAQQAGYADDQGARIAARQLVARALKDNGATSLKTLPTVVDGLVLKDPVARRRWLVGESMRGFAEVSDPDYEPSSEDRKHISQQLSWEIALEVTERARRRFSLEREGVIVVSVDEIGKQVATVQKTWPTCPFDTAQLTDVVRAMVDVMRYTRAVSHPWLKLDPRTLVRNHQLRIGDRAINATRGYGKKKFTSSKDGVDIRGWTAPKHATRMTELLGRVLGKPPTEVNDVVETLASRLVSVGLLTESKLEGRSRAMVDHARLIVSLRDGEPLWRCDRCGSVRSGLLSDTGGKPLCINWRCPGTPAPFDPIEERDFYARQYLSEPRRLIVREHSGQVEGDARLALEARFNDRENPIIDALACTPTLEVGVSLDDLHAVVLRNLPPTPANYAQRVGRAGRRTKVALAVTHAGHGPHDSYYFENPGEMIAGNVRAPVISLENPPVLRRHVNSLVLETLRLDLPEHWVPPIGSTVVEEEPTIADEDGILRETTLAPFHDNLSDPTVRAKVEAAALVAFASDGDPAKVEGVKDLCIEQIASFEADLRGALNRWCNRFGALVAEYKKSLLAKGIPSKPEKDFQDRLYREIVRLSQPASPEYRPLGFLGLVGFLPRYGFTGETVLLHPSGDDEPLAQTAHFAITEFAPGNLVYARGRRLKVHRLDPPPVEEASAGTEHRENVISRGRRCDRCEFLTTDPLEKVCPSCKADLVAQPVLTLTSVAAGGGAISSEDEYRRRAGYDVQHMLGAADGNTETTLVGGYRFTRSSGRTLIVANRGPIVGRSDDVHGFEICTGCGHAAELKQPFDEDDFDEDEYEAAGHRAYCPARKDPHSELVIRGLWLTAGLRGDVMELELPPAAQGSGFDSWRATLSEALQLGIRETMQAGRRDLDGFVRHENDEPVSLVLYDTMPGGTGYIPKLFADGASGLQEAAKMAAERLAGCMCTDSCHRCLRDFWNQRVHRLLDRFQVIGTLEAIAGAEVTEGLDPEDKKLESFLEREFFERLKVAGLPLPTLQVVRVIGERRIIRVDCEYRDPAVSVFLDGRAYHAQSVEKIADDLAVRNELEARGVNVLEYTYGDVMEHFDEVAAQLELVLHPDPGASSVDLETLPGFAVVASDDASRSATVRVDATSWTASEAARLESLRSANLARLGGWSLRRVTD
ncbi:MAG: DEAD/DEAH box helicase [Actinomycetota bacterium]|nr:DEAD/DEAH box helicase [Actinomycetota bacterium]